MFPSMLKLTWQLQLPLFFCLKVKGSSSGIKVGTKIKGIRLVEGNDGHNIDCKVPGVGAIKLKQEFVKKS